MGIGVTLLDENTELGWTPVVRQPARWAGLTFFLPTCGRFVSVWFLSEEHGLFSHAPQTRQGKDLTQSEAVDLSSVHRQFEVGRVVTTDQRHQKPADKRTHFKRKVLVGAASMHRKAERGVHEQRLVRTHGSGGRVVAVGATARHGPGVSASTGLRLLNYTLKIQRVTSQP